MVEVPATSGSSDRTVTAFGLTQRLLVEPWVPPMNRGTQLDSNIVRVRLQQEMPNLIDSFGGNSHQQFLFSSGPQPVAPSSVANVPFKRLVRSDKWRQVYLNRITLRRPGK